jgi:hypothetical protein
MSMRGGEEGGDRRNGWRRSRDCHQEEDTIAEMGGGEAGIAIRRRIRSQKWMKAKLGMPSGGGGDLVNLIVRLGF